MTRRNPGIDFLRGLSILLVVIHHVAIRIPLKHGVLATCLPIWFLNGLVYNGYEAVFIFFVISGFLITSNAFTRWGSLGAIDLGNFYRRRASRILPCLLILIGVLSLFHALGVTDYVIVRADQSLGRAVLSALTFHLNWYEGHTGYLPGGWDVLWSLSIEEVFYIGFPSLCLAIRREWLFVSLLFLLAASLPISHAAIVGMDTWQEKAYLPGMSAIAAGVLGAIGAHRLPVPRKLSLNALAVFGALGILAVLFAEPLLWSWLKDATLLGLTVCATCLVLTFHWSPALGKMCALPGTGWIRSGGRLSYEIYLTHMFVVFLVVRVFKHQGGDLRWGFLWYLPAVGFSWLLGWMVARFISVPLEQAIRRRGYRDASQTS